MKDQPNNQEPTLVRIESYGERSLTPANMAGTNTIHIKMETKAMYFKTVKIFTP